MAFKSFDVNIPLRVIDLPMLQVEDIPIIRMPKRILEPLKPTIPVDDPDISMEVDVEVPIWNGEITFREPPPLLRIEEVDPVDHALVEVPPVLIGLRFEVLQERPLNLGFGAAGVAAIAAMRFTPGLQRDRVVPVRMTQPIKFRVN